MKNLTRLYVFVATTLIMSTFSSAQCTDRCCQLCGKKVCSLEVSEGTEDVTCYDVEAKDICIPGIKLPWECKRRCGGVRTICVLKPVKKEKKVCEYDWSIKCICTTCCKQHGLKHSKRSCDVCQDERVPFDYYATQPLLPEQGLAADTTATRRNPASANSGANSPAMQPSTRQPIAPVSTQAVVPTRTVPTQGFQSVRAGV
ncbi:MAG TPA: hypothetical protein DDW52_09000, partial [Planctomycetaceae bacterium]|nr:hypothetical protein [Planctomycetaceae bacterium]